jgi:dephospho-CoA kinase
MVKIALIGKPGVGKDTFLKLVHQWDFFGTVKDIRLADPFYRLQAQIYDVCGVQKDYYIQDGELLNFLGNHMRKINPNVLKSYFLQQLKNNIFDCSFVICPDARPIDLLFIKEQEFIIVEIICDEKLSLERRHLRGDLSLGNANDTVENSNSVVYADYRIINNGTMKDYESGVLNLIREIYDTYWKRN